MNRKDIDSSKLLETVTNSIPEIIYIKDLKDQFIFVNDYFCSVVGKSRKEIVGKTILEIQPQSIADHFSGLDKEVIATGAPERIELKFVGRGNRENTFDVLKFPFMSNEKSTLGIIGIGRNITREREYESRYQAAMDFAGVIFVDWDFKNNYVHFSSGFYDLMKYRRGSLQGKLGHVIFKLIPATDRAELIQSIRSIIEGGEETFESEIRLLDKNGYSRWFAARGRIPESSNGIITLIDITHQKKLQLELKGYNDQLNHLISSVPGIVFISKFNPRFELEFISDKCKEITGYSANEFIQGEINLRSIITDHDQATVLEEINHAFANRTPYEIKYRIQNKSGNEIWLWEKGYFLSTLSQNSDPVFEGVIMDITELVRIEDRILSATISAEDQERERLALEIHDGVQQLLVSAIFHLKSIEQQIKEADVTIFNRFQSGVKLLKDGLEETRSVSHNIMPRSIFDFGLVQTIEGLVSHLKRAGNFKVKFNENLNQTRLPQNVEVNVYRIIQEATNNIMKYAKATEVTIEMRVENEQFTLQVIDNGIGFNMRTLDKFGKAFGIASMKSRVSAVGGKFAIASKIGNGTKILVEIPLS